MKPAIELVQQWFGYDPERGVLFRKLKTSDGLSNDISPTDKRVYLIGVRYPYTHIIWVVHFGKWPTEYIDHINHNRMDNRLINLREATASQNQHNKKMFNKFKGVAYDKSVPRSKPWIARIMVKNKSMFLGTFATKEEAAEAYRKAALEHHGEFACLE